VVQDNQGEYWMLGLESGDWYWYDGEDWQKRQPPQIIPGEEESQLASSAVQPLEQKKAAAPRPTRRGRWGALALWLISALIVLALGIFTAVELMFFLRGEPLSPLSPKPGGTEIRSAQDQAGTGEDLSPAAEDPTPSDAEFNMDGPFRPYDPIRDSSLVSLTAESEFQEDQSTNDYFFYQSQFNSGQTGILVMGWCAIDQTTLDENMAVIQLEGAFDGSPIPQEIWTQEDSQEGDMVCRYYRTVVENLDLGNHVYVWSTRYDLPVNDGWETFPPGIYFKEYTIQVREEYHFNDDFQNSSGDWGELDEEQAGIWIEGGELHFELNQPGISVISHFKDREFTDFNLVATARSLSDAPGMYGVVFGFQDTQHYYSFQISEQGVYRLIKQAGEVIELVPWTESDAIAGQDTGNTLTVSMMGDLIQASINNQQVVDLRDSDYTSGKLSLIAGAPPDLDHCRAAFQQVSIKAPD
jgi:hypothetical protein